LLARHHFNHATADGVNTAIGLYKDAVDKDPSFARAWASIAVAHHFHLAGYYGMRPREAARLIFENATRALEFDPDIAEAHMILGEVEAATNHNWEAARVRHERALELNPNLAIAHRLYGNYLACVGRHDESVEAGHRALELDPEAEVSHIHSAFLCYVARKYDLVFAGLDIAEAQFGLSLHQITRGETLVALGRAKEAVELFRDLCSRISGTWYRIHLAWGLAAAGEDAEARAVLADLRELEKSEYLWHLGIAAAYAHLGDMDDAFRYLERSVEEREMWSQLSLAPTFDPFRSDPRFDAIALRIGGVSYEMLDACRRTVIAGGGS
jgi:serine/threonine-protein kinase